MSNGRFAAFGLFAALVVAFVCWLSLSKITPALDRRWTAALDEMDGKGNALRRRGLTVRQARLLFDRDAQPPPTDSTDSAVADRYDSNSPTGPLIPVDCKHVARPCLLDRDCKFLCRNSAQVTHVCDQKTSLCHEPPVDIAADDQGGGDDKPTVQCKTAEGEYALLQGYNELGLAEWACVQLFPGWDGGGKRYCEGGVVRLDVRQRNPSYKDCTCPPDTSRIVYARSQLGQQVYGLPHCVKNPKLYNIGLDFLQL